MTELIKLDKEYVFLFNQLKEKIRNAQLRAALAVNREVIQLYRDIGQQILNKQHQTQWGSKLIAILSLDLQNTFPETHGFSVRNLERMRQFASLYPCIDFAAQSVPQLPWGHIVLLMQKVKNLPEQAWYAKEALEHGWSRSMLESHIKTHLYGRQAVLENKASNFLDRLPPAQSSLAHEILKNPYNFDFLGLHDDALEREIEYAATQHITKFLLELGRGFAFVGR